MAQKQAKKRRKKSGFIGKLGAAISIIFIAMLVMGIGAFAYLYFSFAKDLPQIASLKEYKPSLVTRVYDRNDLLIGEYYIEKRILVPLERIPLALRRATIGVEDTAFYKHHGLNIEGIIRAFIANMKAGRVVQGGSSITQQVAKLLFLTPERTLKRKLKEAIISISIERMYTKNEILEIYLNHIYYGHGAYGVEAASQIYFGKRVTDLTLAEISILVGLPKAPTHYSPYNNLKKAKARQNHVLNRMVAIGAITPAQKVDAQSREMHLAGRKKPQNKAPWFAEHVRRLLEKKYGATKLYRGGLTVRTTLDLTLQKYARESVIAGLEKADNRLGYRGAQDHVDIKENETVDWEKLNPRLNKYGHEIDLYKPGNILRGIVLDVEKKKVIVGFEDNKGVIALKHMDWAKVPNPKKNALWAAKIKDARKVLKIGDIIETRILKAKPLDDGSLQLALYQIPIVQGALLAMDPKTGHVLAMVGGYDANTSKFNRAIQAKRQPGSSFKPIIYATALEKGSTPASIMIDAPIIFDRAVTEFRGWKPMNFEQKFFGPTTMRTAVTHSRNIVTIKTVEKIGVKSVIDNARKMGVTSKLDPNLSIALGASPVSPIEMVTVYGSLANGGARAKPIFIMSVEDRNGVILEENRPDLQQAIAPSTAYLMTNIMKGVVKEGTARSIKLKHPIAGKTGTTNNYIDAWFVGFTPEIVCGVWVGRDDNKPMGKKETGSRTAIPIWRGFMKKTLEGMPITDFKPPENIVFVKIDKKSGLLAKSMSENTMFEAFLDGTEPTSFVNVTQSGEQGALETLDDL